MFQKELESKSLRQYDEVLAKTNGIQKLWYFNKREIDNNKRQNDAMTQQFDDVLKQVYGMRSEIDLKMKQFDLQAREN